MKVSVIGCGLRTPLLLHGLTAANLGIDAVSLYDIEPNRSRMMQQLGSSIAAQKPVRMMASATIEAALRDSQFVISSIRVGNIEARMHDERLAFELGFAGQETTGPAGFAKALRTIPVALEHARAVLDFAPGAWIVNFTNPAGMVTQAISTYTKAKVVGICDTPSELSFQIARALKEPWQDLQTDYFGLNHLGWIRAVRVRGEDRTKQLLGNDELLASLYPARLFPFPLIRALRLIPTEYLFFYYEQKQAWQNQKRLGVTRGEELGILNREVLDRLDTAVEGANLEGALATYRRYLNRRNASYMRLDGAGESAFSREDAPWDPFEGATGYHRIAVDAIRALSGSQPRSGILNVPNCTGPNCPAIDDLPTLDVVEVPCSTTRDGPIPQKIGHLPEAVRGLVISVKTYERLTIQAALSRSWDAATYALMQNPIVGSWSAAEQYIRRLAAGGSEYFREFH
jgi:6-phospho-beta-glucosidase